MKILSVRATNFDYYATAVFGSESDCEDIDNHGRNTYMVAIVDMDSTEVPTDGWFEYQADSMEMAAMLLNEEDELFARRKKLLMFELNERVDTYKGVLTLQRVY